MKKKERLRNSDKRPQALLEDISKHDENIEKIQDCIKQYMKINSVLDAKHDQLLEEEEAKKAAVKDLKRKIDELAAQVESQEMKQLDVGRINIDRQSLAEHIKTTREKRLQSEDRAWKKEIEASQSWDSCVELVEEYTELCHQLKLTRGHEFLVSIGSPQDPQLSTDVKQTIRPNLKELITKLRAKKQQSLGRSFSS
eukprot:TRINITY_DN6611_c0_g1_i3.p1 TRINITY_DN6611_c0_g1~~TRINITY_DN6611_c0_g1_i3.p1  ORF type:complete len:213 (-),score=52.08 TRINITY_DN6611_c0_g1_i3:370-960(-)